LLLAVAAAELAVAEEREVLELLKILLLWN
jgi:hypothetical protein